MDETLLSSEGFRRNFRGGFAGKCFFLSSWLQPRIQKSNIDIKNCHFKRALQPLVNSGVTKSS